MQLPRVRFPLRVMMAVVAAIGLLMGLGLWWLRGPLIVVEPAPQPRSASVDHEIYDVSFQMLVDMSFLTFPGMLGTVGQRSSSSRSAPPRTVPWGPIY
ncbi:MAG: hypothetical protein ACP5XB_12825 [Isosphaeraceae bacterium]